MIPGDANASGLPVAVLRYVLHNKTAGQVTASICATLPNFIGMDGRRKPATGREICIRSVPKTIAISFAAATGFRAC